MSTGVLIESANLVGMIGVVLILIAYLLLQLRKLQADGICYSIINVVGSVLILYSLYFYRNLSSIVIEVAWLIISFYGLSRGLYLKFKDRSLHDSTV